MIGKTKVEVQGLLQDKIKIRNSHTRCYRCHKYRHYAKHCHYLDKRKHEGLNYYVDEDTPHKRSRNDDFAESAKDRRKEFFF